MYFKEHTHPIRREYVVFLAVLEKKGNVSNGENREPYFNLIFCRTWLLSRASLEEYTGRLLLTKIGRCHGSDVDRNGICLRKC